MACDIHVIDVGNVLEVRLRNDREAEAEKFLAVIPGSVISTLIYRTT